MTGNGEMVRDAHRITRSEWAWVIAASLLVTVMFSAPYVAGAANATPDMAFSGHLFGTSDMFSYIAKMRYGALDGWLYELVYTTEPHRGGFVFPFYLGLGKLAALVSGQGPQVSYDALVVTYHIARVVCGLLLLLAIYRFMADLLDSASKRRLAWAIAALAGGLGFVAQIFGAAGLIAGAPLPVELYVPEAFTPLLLFGLPHLALARTLLIAGWLGLFRAADGWGWWWVLLAGLAWGGMALIVPFYGAVLGVLVVAWLAALLIVWRRMPWREAMLGGMAGVLPAVVVAYNAWLFTRNPVYAAWSAQNVLPSPPPGMYLLAYGLLIGLAIPGAIALARGGITRRAALVLAWPPVALALAYLPTNVQRRLLEGVILPFGALAAIGVWQLVGPIPDAEPGNTGARQSPNLSWRLRQFAVAALTMLLFPSTLVLLGGGLVSALRAEPPVFVSAEERAALDWLQRGAPPGSAVLSTFDTGNLLPAYAGVRVYVGHGPETVNSARKRERAEAFFFGGMTDSTRRALLEEAGIDYVWYGPREQSILCLCFNPDALGLQAVYEDGQTTIYEVRAP